MAKFDIDSNIAMPDFLHDPGQARPPYYSRDEPSPTILPHNSDVAIKHLELASELSDIRTRRFELHDDVRQLITTRWKEQCESFRQWYRKALTTIHDLREKGGDFCEDANWLAKKLAVNPQFYETNNFRVTVVTGVGQEIHHFTGVEPSEPLDPERNWPTKSTAERSGHLQPGPSTVETPPELSHGCPETRSVKPLPPLTEESREMVEPAQQPLEPAIATAVDEGAERLHRTPTMTLLQARTRMQWITLSSSGIAFCLSCPCSPMVGPAPTQGTDGTIVPNHASHDLFLGQFHNNPFIGDFALRHFEFVHRQVFPGGVAELISKHGEEVVPNSAGGERLDTAVATAHNSCVNSWYHRTTQACEALQQLGRWLHQGGLKRAHADSLTPLMSNKTIRAVTAEGMFSFYPSQYVDMRELQLSNQCQWVLVCTLPCCSNPFFSHDPFVKNGAIDHFASHGVWFKDLASMISVFGFQVITNNVRLEEAKVAEGKSDNAAEPRNVSSTTEKRAYTLPKTFRTMSTNTFIKKCQRLSLPTKNRTRQELMNALIEYAKAQEKQ